MSFWRSGLENRSQCASQRSPGTLSECHFPLRVAQNCCPMFLAFFQGKTKGQQLKGKSVSEIFSLFRTSEFFPRDFPLQNKGFHLTENKQRRKDKLKNGTNRCCTLVVARLSSSYLWSPFFSMDLRVRCRVAPLKLLQERLRRFWFPVLSEEFQGATRLGATGLRGSEKKSASERVSERTSERYGFRAFQSFSEVFRGFQRFSEVFQRPSQRPSQSAIFLSELGSCCP